MAFDVLQAYRNVTPSSNACKAWSFREVDGACRLFARSPVNKQPVVLDAAETDWQSGTGAVRRVQCSLGRGRGCQQLLSCICSLAVT